MAAVHPGNLPRDGSLEWGGQFQNMQRAQRRLTIVVPAALLLIIGLLYLSFRDRFDTLVIFAAGRRRKSTLPAARLTAALPEAEP